MNERTLQTPECEESSGIRVPYQVLVIPYSKRPDGGLEYYLFRRKDSDVWQAIAGGGEESETPTESAIRETCEETGIDNDYKFRRLDSVASLPVENVTGFIWDDDVLVIPEHTFGVEVPPDVNITLSGEHAEYAKLPYDEAMKRLTWDSNRNALWELNYRLKKGLFAEERPPEVQSNLILNGETPMGSVYGEKEVDAVMSTLHASMEPHVGFRAKDETEKLEKGFSKLCGTEHAVALNGAGTALDLVIRALDIQDGDEIVSCATNFAGTHLAIIGNGAKLVLAEPDPTTLNLDPNDLARRLTPRTRAVLVTYMNGLAADMTSIHQVINSSDLYNDKTRPKVIVDAARSLGTTYNGKHVGPEGWVTVFSLQSKKMLTTLGEGGVVVTGDNELDKTLRDNRSFGWGQAWGSNFKMTKLQAAIGLPQLDRLATLTRLRRELAEQRNRALSQFPEITIQGDTEYSQNSYYLYTMILPENLAGSKRDELMRILRDDYGVGSVVANPPTYQSNALIRIHTRGQSLPVAEELGSRILCLPIHPDMNDETNRYVINSFIEAYGKTKTD